jgi:tRNA nucleotidyltransferase (CCA-adding enzyme)
LSRRSATALRQRLIELLGPRAAALRVVHGEARAAGADLYLVGGPVRDLLMRRPVSDLDLMVSTGVAEIARRSARRLGTHALVHQRFMTATLELDGFVIDIAHARNERYPSPGALPQVRPASAREDLARRDFTIHAMALPLSRSGGDQLLDPFGGATDLRNGVLRILHVQSFADDPTRLFRAARYAARLRFQLSRATRDALRRALRTGAVDTLSGSRIAHEIERLLAEAAAAQAALATQRYGLFAAAHSAWRLGRPVLLGMKRFDRLRRRRPWSELHPEGAQAAAGLRLLLLGVAPRSLGGVLDRLGMRGRPREALVRDLDTRGRLARSLAATRSPGRVDALLSSSDDARLLFLCCALGAAGAGAVERYAADYRQRPSPLDGHAARRLGLRGPAVGALLREARRRALDGEPVDVEWQRRWLARAKRMG